MFLAFSQILLWRRQGNRKLGKQEGVVCWPKDMSVQEWAVTGLLSNQHTHGLRITCWSSILESVALLSELAQGVLRGRRGSVMWNAHSLFFVTTLVPSQPLSCPQIHSFYDDVSLHHRQPEMLPNG